MNASKHSVMYYHADANPLGGYVTHPITTHVPSQGSVSLAATGGSVSSEKYSLNLDGIFSCDEAYSSATGTPDSDNNWATTVTATVKGLNVLSGIVVADEIISTLTLVHPQSGGYPSISFAGSEFKGLKIGGADVKAPITPTMVVPSTSSGTDEDVAPIQFPDVPWPEVPGFATRVRTKTQTMVGHPSAPDWVKGRYQWASSDAERAKRGYSLCSLVDQVTGTDHDTTFGHIVHVPKFGNIFLGELIVNAHSFHLTMLRMEMGCDADGSISAGSTRGNGLPMPGGGG